MQNLVFLLLVLGALVYFFVFPRFSLSGEDFNPDISFKLVKQGAVLIDVRSQEEYNSGHIEGAVNISHIDIKEKEDFIKQLTNDNKKKPIVVYCQSGRRSSVAKNLLNELGYSEVTNHGGIGTWKRQSR